MSEKGVVTSSVPEKKMRPLVPEEDFFDQFNLLSVVGFNLVVVLSPEWLRLVYAPYIETLAFILLLVFLILHFGRYYFKLWLALKRTEDTLYLVIWELFFNLYSLGYIIVMFIAGYVVAKVVVLYYNANHNWVVMSVTVMLGMMIYTFIDMRLRRRKPVLFVF